MTELYGPRRSFANPRAAENFLRHLTRELTSGGIPHWTEVRELAPGTWVPFVHKFDCEGGESCRCGAPAEP
jgi:hypothetical protein